MKRKDIFLSLCIVAVVIVSAAVLFHEAPEKGFVESEDGIVHISGVWRAEQPVSIRKIGDVYLLEPEWPIAEEPLTLTFKVDQDTHSVYRWNEQFSMWEATEQYAAVSRLGKYMIGPSLDIEASQFLSEYDALLKMAPVETVGYEIAVGVRQEGGRILRLGDLGQVGGCDGLLGRGNMHERSMRTLDARIFINDVETLVTLVFVGDWTVGTSGCGEGASLKAANEYGTIKSEFN